MADEKKQPIRITKKMIQLVEVILKNGTEEQKQLIFDAIDSYKLSVAERKKELRKTINMAKKELNSLNGIVSDVDSPSVL